MSWTRVKKVPPKKPDKDLYDQKVKKIIQYEELESKGKIDMFRFDESGFSPTSNCPYLWSEVNNTAKVKTLSIKRINVLGFLSRNGTLKSYIADGRVDSDKVIEVFDMPTMIDGKKSKRQVNGSQVTNIIKEQLNNNTEKETVVVVEHVNAMPGQGVTSMFNFGQSFGVLKGICSALSLPIHFVRPTKWKKHL